MKVCIGSGTHVQLGVYTIGKAVCEACGRTVEAVYDERKGWRLLAHIA